MNTDKQIEVLVEQLQHNATDYREGNKESLFSMSAIMNQIVILARESMGFSSYDGGERMNNGGKSKNGRGK